MCPILITRSTAVLSSVHPATGARAHLLQARVALLLLSLLLHQGPPPAASGPRTCLPPAPSPHAALLRHGLTRLSNTTYTPTPAGEGMVGRHLGARTPGRPHLLQVGF
jgi:hypothetical protein